MEGRILELAPAKLNLILDVLGKRPDGYHELETVMQSVDLRDEVYITLTDRPGIKVDISRDDLPRDLHNLAGKAAQVFLSYVNLPDQGVEVYINKRIPDKAGLAGGSSDAAAVIRGLDALLDTGLCETELLDISGRVGSDVPFCLLGGTRLCRGCGEIMTELPELPDCSIVIVKPDFSVSTPELFAALDSKRVLRRPDTGGFLKALNARELTGLGPYTVNVFEEVLPEDLGRRVQDIKDALLAAGALGASMTGTGSAVFGIFEGTVRPVGLSGFGDVFFVKPLKSGE